MENEGNKEKEQEGKGNRGDDYGYQKGISGRRGGKWEGARGNNNRKNENRQRRLQNYRSAREWRYGDKTEEVGRMDGRKSGIKTVMGGRESLTRGQGQREDGKSLKRKGGKQRKKKKR